MLFNSFDFAVFLVIVFFLYWFVFSKNLKLQNFLLFVSSYVFYGWWDWRFLILLFISTIIDFFFGLLLYNSQNRKKLFLFLSVLNNIGILAFFKYYNFFAASFKELLAHFRFHAEPYFLDIVLPVGISFYTFHGMSYVFDIYRGKTLPTKNFIDYAVFVCFFPLLVAGPIERAWHLLPQVQKKREFSYTQSIQGMQLILWGFFKKVVIADSLAPIVDNIFSNTVSQSGLFLIIGVLYFSIQIYCDFSGYTDIARGTARLFGFELLVNFRFPYFSRDIAEFWRRWHISLSSWFRDYVYVPLGGSKEGTFKAIRNTLIIFALSGFWHGANWTFIFWGLLHAIYFLPLLILKKNRTNIGPIAPNSMLPGFREFFGIFTTFIIVCFAWIFFRAANLSEGLNYINRIFTNKFYIKQKIDIEMYYLPLFILFLFTIEWSCRNQGIEQFFYFFKNRYLKYAACFFLVVIIILFGSFKQNAFIYFQF